VTTLITGAGLIGAYVGRELQQRGESIIFYDLAPSREYLATVLPQGETEIFSGDITNLPELASIVRRFQVDKIVHTAGLIGAQVSRQPYLGIQVNLGGTIAVMEAARLNGLERLIFCSSMAIYDFERLPSKALISEDCPTGPKNLYGATKLACEQLLDQFGAIYQIQVIHLRLAGVYGRGQYAGGSWMGRILNRVMEASIAGARVTIRPEWIGTNEYVYVKDVARAAASACLLPHVPGGAFNIGTGLVHSFPEFIHELRAAAPGVQIEIAESDTPVVSYLQRDQAFDISKAGTELGYAPQYTFRTGLQDYREELKRFSGTYPRLD
jgi:UDP-glucuronate 4-epimerase